MNNNVFTFGDTYWHQLRGTAMGTSCACLYATLYYTMPYMKDSSCFRNISLNLSTFGNSLMTLSDYGMELECASSSSNAIYLLGSLDWTSPGLATKVDFLHLTIQIDGTQLTTRAERSRRRWTYFFTSSHQLPSTSHQKVWAACYKAPSTRATCANTGYRSLTSLTTIMKPQTTLPHTWSILLDDNFVNTASWLKWTLCPFAVIELIAALLLGTKQNTPCHLVCEQPKLPVECTKMSSIGDLKQIVNVNGTRLWRMGVQQPVRRICNFLSTSYCRQLLRAFAIDVWLCRSFS